MKKLFIALAITGIFTGCGENTPVQTVEWYKSDNHDVERKEMLAKCQNNPGELAASPNCINAQKAQTEKDLSRRSYLKMPSVDLGKKGD